MDSDGNAQARREKGSLQFGTCNADIRALASILARFWRRWTRYSWDGLLGYGASARLRPPAYPVSSTYAEPTGFPS